MRPHPNADRLQIVDVAYGDERVATVVTGATNLAVGDKVPLALAGARIANPRDPANPFYELMPRALRGVESQGMVCAEDELGLGDDHAGIMHLDPSAVVVMISGHATIQTAVEATQLGAYDILEKPLDTDRILVTLRNALQHLDLHEENARLKETIQSRYEIVGRSYAIRAVIDASRPVSKLRSPVRPASSMVTCPPTRISSALPVTRIRESEILRRSRGAS